MKLSVVLLSFNSINYLEKCILSLIDSFSELFEYEVIVVDNGSNDGSVELLRSLEKKYNNIVKGIYLKKNTGTTYSRNKALKSSTGDYILILDSDAYVSREPVQFLMNYLDEHTECGIAVPRLIYPDGRFQISVDQFPTVSSKLKRFLFLKNMEKKETNLSAALDVDYAISAFWLFRRDVLEKVGLLDEKIFYSPEDVDYCIRVWAAGFTIRYFPMVSVVHDAQEISRSKGLRINLFTLSHAKGLLYLFFKHRYLFGLSRLYRRLGKTA